MFLPSWHRTHVAAAALYRRVRAETAYEPVLHALPYAFTQRVSEAEQVTSLMFHAEKKTLAALLLAGAPALALRINFGVCAECHAFLTHAAKLLGRPFTVLEPSKEHVFKPSGGCSCACGDGAGHGGGMGGGHRDVET